MIAKSGQPNLKLVQDTATQGDIPLSSTAALEEMTEHQRLIMAYNTLKDIGEEVHANLVLEKMQREFPAQPKYDTPPIGEEKTDNSSRLPLGKSLEGNNSDMTAQKNDKEDAILNRVNVILGGLVFFFTLITTIVFLQITATQSIRDETVAKTSAILSEIKSNNEKVLNEIEGVRSDMHVLRNDVSQKLEMQDLKSDNKLLKDKLERQKQ